VGIYWHIGHSFTVYAQTLLLIIFIHQYMVDMQKNNNDTTNKKLK